MRSDRAFEVGNRVAAPAVIAGGLAAVICGLLALGPAADAQVTCVSLGAPLMGVLVVVGGLRGNRAARGSLG